MTLAVERDVKRDVLLKFLILLVYTIAVVRTFDQDKSYILSYYCYDNFCFDCDENITSTTIIIVPLIVIIILRCVHVFAIN